MSASESIGDSFEKQVIYDSVARTITIFQPNENRVMSFDNNEILDLVKYLGYWGFIE